MCMTLFLMHELLPKSAEALGTNLGSSTTQPGEDQPVAITSESYLRVLFFTLL